MKLPHPIPYQRSKRNLADQIMRFYPDNFDRLIEPFSGSATMTIASAFYFKASNFIINDINDPLAQLCGIISSTILNQLETTITTPGMDNTEMRKITIIKSETSSTKLKNLNTSYSFWPNV